MKQINLFLSICLMLVYMVGCSSNSPESVAKDFALALEMPKKPNRIVRLKPRKDLSSWSRSLKVIIIRTTSQRM